MNTLIKSSKAFVLVVFFFCLSNFFSSNETMAQNPVVATQGQVQLLQCFAWVPSDPPSLVIVAVGNDCVGGHAYCRANPCPNGTVSLPME